MATNYDLFTQRRDMLIIELNSVIDDIIENHIRLKQKASGNFIKSLEVIPTANGAQIVGVGYTKYLVNGRGKGKMPPKANIVQWLQDKFNYDKKTAEKLAFPIMKKIAKEGTDIYKRGGTNLIDAVINDNRINEILDKIKVLTNDFLKFEINKMMVLR